MPWLRTVSIDDPVQRLAALESAPPKSPEVLLAQARAALEAGDYERVDEAVHALLVDDPWEWRAVWMSGLVALARERTAEAQSAFNAAYGQVPGELAPKLALAFACEAGGEADVAESLYMACARTDANYIAPAAFGLARIRAGRGDIAGAITRAGPGAGDQPGLHPGAASPGRSPGRVRWRPASLAAALESIDNLTIDPVDRSRFRVDVLHSALELVESHGADTDGPDRWPSGVRAVPARRTRGGIPRPGRYAASREERVDLVDQANAVRRWTLR